MRRLAAVVLVLVTVASIEPAIGWVADHPVVWGIAAFFLACVALAMVGPLVDGLRTRPQEYGNGLWEVDREPVFPARRVRSGPPPTTRRTGPWL